MRRVIAIMWVIDSGVVFLSFPPTGNERES